MFIRKLTLKRTNRTTGWRDHVEFVTSSPGMELIQQCLGMTLSVEPASYPFPLTLRHGPPSRACKRHRRAIADLPQTLLVPFFVVL